ncbi:Tfp pilus assembly major pilin PilA [Actimicrobium sp. GrIS 1.19]|uniref:DUF4845 domain-containing protein n=1 Tax=Actimicrobium sp. GrIS 1.19 TaxID=3071708 RepID=UPI002DF9A1FE|nr:Tfp pilus assembly major pilin PilA [Actimicrobium sp. GrIS 1.19]
MRSRAIGKQGGITLVGLIFVLAILGLIGVIGLKVFPTVVEFMSVKKALVAAKASGSTPVEIRTSFDKQATTGYIDSVTSKDLVFSKDDGEIEVSIAYQKKIPLFGPASLLMEYEATTAKSATKKPAV